MIIRKGKKQDLFTQNQECAKVFKLSECEARGGTGKGVVDESLVGTGISRVTDDVSGSSLSSLPDTLTH